MASKKKVSKKETRPTKKPEIKTPDSEARVKRDVSDLKVSPYWTLEEFFCLLIGKLDWPWDSLYSKIKEGWSDADRKKFDERFPVAHNLGLDLLKAAEKGEIECAGTPPDPFPDSFENKFDDGPSGRLWNPAALDLKLIRESCLRYCAKNKPAIKFRFNEVGHGIPKFNESLLDGWADALPQETENRTATTPKSKYPKNPPALRFKFIFNEVLESGKTPTLEGIRNHMDWPLDNFSRSIKTMKHWLTYLKKEAGIKT